ncbi:MAG: DUF6388 family protein [Pseudomonas veronii]|jgi:hypothetical protein|nr:DUF6388 family protein [Pseudomonas veronii]
MNSDELRKELALSKFFEGDSSLNEAVQGLSQAEKKVCIESAFEQEAARLGIAVWELTLTMISESPEELKSMTLASIEKCQKWLRWNGRITARSMKSSNSTWAACTGARGTCRYRTANAD